MIHLITGGIKSGKSSRALAISVAWEFPVSFIATAEPLDDEMRLRIQRHRAERAALRAQICHEKGSSGACGHELCSHIECPEGGFRTIEEPLELGAALAGCGERVLIDCLPMWVNNIMYYQRERDFAAMLDALIAGIKTKEECAIVTNETGLGNVPFDESSRRYNLLLAEANRKIAAAADIVELMVCGIPLVIKKPA